jgi:hypothetical protein
MNYKYELEKYLNSSKTNHSDLTNSHLGISKVESTFIQTTVLSESTILPSHKYNKVIEECLNFEDVDTRKVFYIKIEL